jgi:hypothetical protein
MGHVLAKEKFQLSRQYITTTPERAGAGALSHTQGSGQ